MIIHTDSTSLFIFRIQTDVPIRIAFKPQQTRFEGGAHFQNRKDDGVGNGRNRYTTNIASEQVEPQVKSSQRHLFKHDKDIYIYMYTAVQY